MAPLYEIVVFTASLSKYADPLLNIIDKYGYCSYRLFREHCTFNRGSFVKDLERLGRSLNEVIIVDNAPASYMFQPENAYPCLSWYDDMKDRELYDMVPLLESIATVRVMMSLGGWCEAVFEGYFSTRQSVVFLGADYYK